MHPEFYAVSRKKRNQLENHGVYRKIIYGLKCLEEIRCEHLGWLHASLTQQRIYWLFLANKTMKFKLRKSQLIYLLAV
jgi:hypothetical protein